MLAACLCYLFPETTVPVSMGTSQVALRQERAGQRRQERRGGKKGAKKNAPKGEERKGAVNIGTPDQKD